MPGSNEQQQKSPSTTATTGITNNTNTNPNSDDDHHVDDSEDEESEILEESPCGRWVKRREKVDQRDVPGIDAAYLAMDTEEGVEVVWNEVLFSERKNFKAQEEQIRQTFDNLTRLEHPNIVKFHKYWTDTTQQTDKPRVVFITEYMSSGSLKQFLKRTKKNGKPLPLAAWKRWCTQILSALNYLHSCNPPIIHGNLTCDTIFIQHNGLVKIGSVAPDAIHHHVKSFRDNIKNMHFVAPEYGTPATVATPAVDIYSFGMCALEMAALEIQGNGDSGTLVTSDHINRTIESLDPNESPVIEFVRTCIQEDPTIRPTGRELLFHPALFEVPSLKLISAHALVNRSSKSETISDEVLQRHCEPNRIIAEIVRKRRGTDPLPPEESKEPSELISFPYWISDIQVTEKLEKFLEDVKYGIYPMTCYELPDTYPVPSPTPEVIDSVKSTSPEPADIESRRVMNMMCNVKSREDGPGLLMTILVRMDDKMNRQLSCVVSETDTAIDLANELVFYGFIHEADRDKLTNLIEDSLYNRLTGGQRTLSPNCNLSNLCSGEESSSSSNGSGGTLTGNGSNLFNPLSQHNLGTLTSCN